MNKEILESNWTQVREILREKFNNLSEEDIRQINGRFDQLVAKLQQKYGYSKEEAEERIRNWNFDRFATAKGQNIREERTLRREDTSSALKWLLGLGIPLLLLGAYFLGTRNPEVPTTPTTTQERMMTIENATDRNLTTGIRNALMQNLNASDLQFVRITSNNGIVTLTGSVSSQQISNAIEARVQNFNGVRQVNNNLQVR